MSVGTRIRDIRERRNLSQRYLARSLGMSNSTFSKYESGALKIDADWLPVLARLMSVSPCEFFTEAEPTVEEIAARSIELAWDALSTTERQVIERLIASRQRREEPDDAEDDPSSEDEREN